MTTPNPLDIPELLDRVLWNLHHSTKDLSSCALVARVWVYPAQVYLFRTLRFYQGISAKTLIITLLAPRNAHLLPHIQHLLIDYHRDDTAGNDALQNMLPLLGRAVQPCPNLTRLTFQYSGDRLARVAITGLRDLLFVKSLQTVTIHCRAFSSEEDFWKVWGNCSPNIRHLNLMCAWYERPGTRPNDQKQPKTIPLASFCLPRTAQTHLAKAMLEALPFALNNLTTLSVSSANHSAVLWEALRPRNNIQRLHFRVEPYIASHATPFELSAFPKLIFVDFAFPLHQTHINILANLVATIPPTNQLQTMQLEQYSTPEDRYNGRINPSTLDSTIAAIPGAFEVWLKMTPGMATIWRHGFSHTSKSKLVRNAAIECECYGCRPLTTLLYN
ncbi:hypothetical protein MIND_00675300 [Mycena indigotica]|uniref:Uncharacterized protein n=1 Tax=Mycena indigotica TaxID=2126181 RepID=A0A8H6W470_9AGAR|nr:uncharacterized protein MIND_00675300 [Mycena indigotica]KAF7301113.1 hypothetical protein MIND_00675300 [Mycena indigotica]